MRTLFKRRHQDPLVAFRKLVGGYELPTFPTVVTQTLRVLRDPNSSLRDIAETVRVDPGMVIRILGTVNSAAYGLASPVENLPHGISLMGRGQVESLMLALAVKDCLPGAPMRGFEPTRFWQAAARRAALASSIAAVLHPSTQAECFTAALLQDMSIPVLASQQSDVYGAVLERWHEDPATSLYSLESEVESLRHDEIGAIMGEIWGLPDTLVRSVGAHHGGGKHEVSAAVRLVSCLRETIEDPGTECLIEMARVDYGMRPDDVVTMVDDAFETAGELAASLG